ncbi:hypothetical protein AWU82_15690 [Pseudomonas glycinae]|uniref:Uncharacterized protein n=1 Tax=Pseudomonas glycinae TaxID=1785145 RepID=A0ABN4MSR6_9PSED|nr:hypothetical protein AWU82_15690 [Pseudomonas glycinae]
MREQFRRRFLVYEGSILTSRLHPKRLLNSFQIHIVLNNWKVLRNHRSYIFLDSLQLRICESNGLIKKQRQPNKKSNT